MIQLYPQQDFATPRFSYASPPGKMPASAGSAIAHTKAHDVLLKEDMTEDVASDSIQAG